MRLRPPFIIAISVGAILISVLGIFMLLDPSTDIGTRFYGGGMILWAIYWLFFRRKVGEWIFRRHFKKEDAANKKIDWIFSEEMVTSNCEGLVKAEMSWLLFDKIVETTDGFMLYQKREKTFFWLPFNAFEIPDGPEMIKRFAIENKLKHVQI
jgi:hypothetical protein